MTADSVNDVRYNGVDATQWRDLKNEVSCAEGCRRRWRDVISTLKRA